MGLEGAHNPDGCFRTMDMREGRAAERNHRSYCYEEISVVEGLTGQGTDRSRLEVLEVDHSAVLGQGMSTYSQDRACPSFRDWA